MRADNRLGSEVHSARLGGIVGVLFSCQCCLHALSLGAVCGPLLRCIGSEKTSKFSEIDEIEKIRSVSAEEVQYSARRPE